MNAQDHALTQAKTITLLGASLVNRFWKSFLFSTPHGWEAFILFPEVRLTLSVALAGKGEHGFRDGARRLFGL